MLLRSMHSAMQIRITLQMSQVTQNTLHSRYFHLLVWKTTLITTNLWQNILTVWQYFIFQSHHTTLKNIFFYYMYNNCIDFFLKCNPDLILSRDLSLGIHAVDGPRNIPYRIPVWRIPGSASAVIVYREKLEIYWTWICPLIMYPGQWHRRRHCSQAVWTCVRCRFYCISA